jgi:hypothetical protein
MSAGHPKGSDPFRRGTPPSAYSTSGSFCHRSVEDPNPVPGMPSLDLRLVRVNQEPQPALIPLEGPKHRTKEGGVNGR